MTTTSHRIRRAYLLVAATALFGIAVPGCASASPSGGVAYTDTHSTGYITLYDRSGRQIGGGGVHDRPFVWQAVASTRAAAPYDGAGRKATLLAYQPRQGADPATWSGDTLTASTTYTDPAKPTVQATETDFTLADFLDEYPARWDGLVQLRIYLGVPNNPTFTSSYASTDIRVNGDRWTVVRGAPGVANAPGGAAAVGAAGANGGTAIGDLPRDGAGTGVDGVVDGPVSAVLPAMGMPIGLTIAALVVVTVIGAGLLWRGGPRGTGMGAGPR